MFGMVVGSAIAMSAFAQDGSNTALPVVPPAQLPPTAAAPSAPLPTVQLPSVTVPAMTAPAPISTATPAAPAASSAEAALPAVPASAAGAAPVNPLAPSAAVAPAPPKVFSYGKSESSILFLPAQIDRMKTAIRTFESSTKVAAPVPTFVAPQPEAIAAAPPKINEPSSYPVFYLASIAYHTPTDWSVWVSGHRITSYKNDTDLNVVRVSPESVTFSWSPEYLVAINQRYTQKLFAPRDAVKHRLLTGQEIKLDNTANTIIFTLRLNQSFAVGYFSMFEGYIAAPAMPAMKLDTPPVVAVVTPEQAAEAKAEADAAVVVPADLQDRSILPTAQSLKKALNANPAQAGDAATVPATPAAPAAVTTPLAPAPLSTPAAPAPAVAPTPAPAVVAPATPMISTNPAP